MSRPCQTAASSAASVAAFWQLSKGEKDLYQKPNENKQQSTFITCCCSDTLRRLESVQVDGLGLGGLCGRGRRLHHLSFLHLVLTRLLLMLLLYHSLRLLSLNLAVGAVIQRYHSHVLLIGSAARGCFSRRTAAAAAVAIGGDVGRGGGARLVEVHQRRTTGTTSTTASSTVVQ